MAIQSADILYQLSGGNGNADPNASLGGIISGTDVLDAFANNLFDDVSGDESAAGDVEYRCFYIVNSHGTLTWQNVVVWIGTETPDTETQLDIGLDAAGVGDGSTTGVATTIATESDAPAGAAFTHNTSKATGLNVGNIPAGEAVAVWLRRTVTAGAAAYNNDYGIIRAEGETAA